MSFISDWMHFVNISSKIEKGMKLVLKIDKFKTRKIYAARHLLCRLIYSGSNKIVTPLGRPARPRPFCRPGAAFQRRRRGLPSQPSSSALSAMSASLIGHVGQPYRPCRPALSAMSASLIGHVGQPYRQCRPALSA
ncbi:hypothetical protein BpHYR1_011030, partial [Brachionus plicatilis]